MTRKVSARRSKATCPDTGSITVAVRQQPLTAILSPGFTPLAIARASRTSLESSPGVAGVIRVRPTSTKHSKSCRRNSPASSVVGAVVLGKFGRDVRGVGGSAPGEEDE